KFRPRHQLSIWTLRKVRSVRKNSELYGRIVNDIAPDLMRDRYTFKDLSDFEYRARDESIGRAYMGHIYWTEMLYRAHMASVASVFRTSRWIK
ncbi:hypothetical protein, partial [Mesorhizobium sp. M8A.F.Ca.ET.213.01.1.1]|uniref:hypothetical protein n=1 Tax=Mesorhizobium sp. M8A.F.Ca.ET.213.01.1.1 TaxID=2563970 RepID=UPI001AEDEF9F